MATPENGPASRPTSEVLLRQLKSISGQDLGFGVLVDYHKLQVARTANLQATQNLDLVPLYDAPRRKQLHTQAAEAAFELSLVERTIDGHKKDMDGYDQKVQILFPLGDKFIKTYIEEEKKKTGIEIIGPNLQLTWQAVNKLGSLLE